MVINVYPLCQAYSTVHTSFLSKKFPIKIFICMTHHQVYVGDTTKSSKDISDCLRD